MNVISSSFTAIGPFFSDCIECLLARATGSGWNGPDPVEHPERIGVLDEARYDSGGGSAHGEFVLCDRRRGRGDSSPDD